MLVTVLSRVTRNSTEIDDFCRGATEHVFRLAPYRVDPAPTHRSRNAGNSGQRDTSEDGNVCYFLHKLILINNRLVVKSVL